MAKTWYGIIIIAYKTNPLRLLLLKNSRTNTITPIAGTRKKYESKIEAAIREIYEETLWIAKKKDLIKTKLVHKFIYGPQKVERAFEQGENQVFLLNTDQLNEPLPTKDAKEHNWYSPKETIKKVDFSDLKSIISNSIKLIKKKENL